MRAKREKEKLHTFVDVARVIFRAFFVPSENTALLHGTQVYVFFFENRAIQAEN